MNLQAMQTGKDISDNIMQENMPTKEGASNADGKDISDNIMQKNTPTGKASSSKSESDEDIPLSALLPKKKSKSVDGTNKKCTDPPRRSSQLKNASASPKKKKKSDFSCNDCGKVFLTKNGLYKHEVSHSGLKYFCAMCGKGFVWNCELEDHER